MRRIGMLWRVMGKIAVVMAIICLGAGLVYSQTGKSRPPKTTILILTGNVTTKARIIYNYTPKGAYPVAQEGYNCFEIEEAVSDAGTPMPKLKGSCLELTGNKAEDVEKYTDKGRIKIKGYVAKDKIKPVEIISTLVTENEIWLRLSKEDRISCQKECEELSARKELLPELSIEECTKRICKSRVDKHR